jgi:hypothetical protein
VSEVSSNAEPSYWVFSNKPAGEYENSIWDLSTILQTHEYSIKRSEANRANVRPGDVAYMRIYGQSFHGHFTIAGEWQPAPKEEQRWPSLVVGRFPMENIVTWSRPVPQNLVLEDLSNRNHRRRIVRITARDGTIIETAQRVYARLGFGGADGEIVILEEGLEEAIKPNLKRLGLKLAAKGIQQQFSMGIGVGRSDLICVNEVGDLIVVELKRGLTSDETIGQVLRYVGWVRENIAEADQKVRGWIVAGDYDEHLRLAAAAAGVKLLLVRLA